MRKAALAPVLTLLLSLTDAPTFFNHSVFAASAHDTGSASIPSANDFIYPVGNPRIAPNFDSTAPNGYEITQMFNNSCNPALAQGYYYGSQYFCGHTGVDLSDRASGGVVSATANGIVVHAGFSWTYGEMVRIEHVLPDGSVVYSQYEHMVYGNLLVGYGQIVTMGQPIGYVGATGFVTGAHLHFEIKDRDEDGVGYTFGNAALIAGYDEPISFVAAHTLQLLPTPTSTPIAATTPSTQVLALNATAPRAGRAPVNYGDNQQAVLEDFYRRYPSYVTVTVDHLNVRAGSGFNYTPLNSVLKGARLGYLGMSGNGWVHVALPANIDGYVARQWVEGKALPRLPPIDMSATLKPPFSQVLDARYPARNGPKMHDAAIEVLKPGENLTYLGTMGSWDKVVLPSGRIGWVLSWYLRDPKNRVDLAPPAPRRITVICPCVVTTVDSLRLRQGPSLSTAVVEGLAKGARLSLRGYQTSWASVVAPDGRQGYVLDLYVRPSAAAARLASPVTCPCVAITADHLNVRQGPRLSAMVLESLPRGTRLSLHGYHTSWVAVTTPDGQEGYVMARYVHTVGAVAMTTASAAAVRSGTSVAAPSQTASATPTVAPTTPAEPSAPAAVEPPTATSTAASAAPATPTAPPTATTADAAASGTDTAATPTPTPVSGFTAPYVYVNVDHANVRAAPGLTAAVFVSQPRDTPLALLGVSGDWDHVETSTGVIGWIKIELVRGSSGA